MTERTWIGDSGCSIDSGRVRPRRARDDGECRQKNVP